MRPIKFIQKCTKFITIIGIAFGFITNGFSQELVVWSAGAARAPLEILLPQFENQTHTSLVVQYAPVGVLMAQLSQGGQPDVLILSADVIKQAEENNYVVANSSHPLGNVGIGLAVREGHTLPDISTPDALRQTLLKAQSITYMHPSKGTSGKHFASVVQTLGITEQLKSKTTLGDAGYVLEPVARGEIEIGIQQITEILPVKGAVLVGPLPDSLQKITTYSVVLGAHSNQNQATSTQLSQFLQTHASALVFKEKGFFVDK
jgi:molybdate transport system substrate-binding protein